jgi:hypothetical protein
VRQNVGCGRCVRRRNWREGFRLSSLSPFLPLNQASQQGQLLQDSQIVRPSMKERDAINQLLTTKPRPKTLNDADIKYLRNLLDKAAWFDFERRMVHEIWQR